KRHAYSCEENCPTGALVRVNPLEYFTELRTAQGLVFQDQTRAIGRNIHKSDPLARAWHFAGVGGTVFAVLACVLGLVKYGFSVLVNGGSLTMCWLTGLVGLFGVAAVMTSPLRKQVYRHRVGALRYWLLAHIYLGVMAGLVLMLHSGTRTGGVLTTLLY